MGKPIDHTGQVFGCFTVLGKAPSIQRANGAIAVWNVRCVCGHEKTMHAQPLKNKKHVSCRHESCSQRWAAPTRVNCSECSAPYEIQRRTKMDECSRICRRCKAKKAASSAAGKPAHNRLPDSDGGFNLLFDRYKRTAASREISFHLSRLDFKALTQKDCYYCGAAPSQISVGAKGSPVPYVYNGIDRIDSSQSYELGNVVACCAVCNYMKSDLSVEEFLKKVCEIASRHRNKETASP